MTLRVTILTLVVGLLLGTVGTIAGFGFYFSEHAIEGVRDRYAEAVSHGTAKGIAALTERAHPLLRSLEPPQSFDLNLNDEERAFAFALARRMRAESELTWLGFGNQDGHYVGVRRDDLGRLILNRSDLRINNGQEAEWLIERDHSLVPLPAPSNRSYDPREREWYTRALENNFGWTRPYRFFDDNRWGISASVPVHDGARGVIRGVVQLDITLEHLSKYLGELKGHSQSEIFVVSPNGSVIATSGRPEDTPQHAAMHRTIDGRQSDLEQLSHQINQDVTIDGVGYSVSVFPLDKGGRSRWLTVVVIPDREFLGVVYENAHLAILVGVIATVIALMVSYLLAARIATPLKILSQDVSDIAQFKINERGPPRSHIKEVAVMSDAVARMKAGLKSFSRYVPSDLVRAVLQSGREARLGGETKVLSLHFSDLAGFSSASEKLTPTEVVQSLAIYLDIVTQAIRECAGTISQYTGDGVFAFFNAPLPVPNHASAAVLSALKIVKRLAAINELRRDAGMFEFNNRIGLHTAEVLVGNIGTYDKLAYTALGDGVNLASRLEGLNKVYGTCIIASEVVQRGVGDEIEWRALDRVAVLGRSEATLILEPLGPRGEVDHERLALRDLYERALHVYFEGKFDRAIVLFEELLALDAHDGPTQVLARRCREYLSNPPGEWRGYFTAHSK